MHGDFDESASRIICKLREVLERNRDSFSVSDVAAINAAIAKLEGMDRDPPGLRKANAVEIVILLLRILAGSGLVDKIM